MSLSIEEIQQRPIVSQEDALNACRELVEAYRKGAESGGDTDWEDVDAAYASALSALGMTAEDNEPEEDDDEGPTP